MFFSIISEKQRVLNLTKIILSTKGNILFPDRYLEGQVLINQSSGYSQSASLLAHKFFKTFIIITIEFFQKFTPGTDESAQTLHGSPEYSQRSFLLWRYISNGVDFKECRDVSHFYFRNRAITNSQFKMISICFYKAFFL